MKNIELPLPKVSSKQRELYDILTGKYSGEGFYNASGTILSDGVALLRVNDERNYVLAIVVDGELYRTQLVPACDPSIIALADQITVFGDSPEIKQRKAAHKKRAEMSPEEAMTVEEDLRRSWGCNVSKSVGGVPITISDKRNAPDVNVV